MAATHKMTDLYSDTQGATANILFRIAEGQSLTSICKIKGMPHIATFYRWLRKDIGLREEYARARADQADTLADELIDIADTEPDAAKARNMIDVRKWAASKLKPKKYGDLKQIDITGSIDFAAMTDEQLAKQLQDRLAQHGLVTDSATPLIEDTQGADIIEAETVPIDD